MTESDNICQLCLKEINGEKYYVDKYPHHKDCKNKVLEYLRGGFDFTQLLKRARKITKFHEEMKGRWGSDNQLLHIYEEVTELAEARTNGIAGNFEEEACDVIYAVLTLLHLHAYSDEDILKALSNNAET